jgi:hypothetical protein
MNNFISSFKKSTRSRLLAVNHIIESAKKADQIMSSPPKEDGGDSVMSSPDRESGKEEEEEESKQIPLHNFQKLTYLEKCKEVGRVGPPVSKLDFDSANGTFHKGPFSNELEI